MSKPKKSKPANDAATPGAIMGEKIRARANKLTDAERDALTAEAMRIIYRADEPAAHAHRR